MSMLKSRGEILMEAANTAPVGKSIISGLPSGMEHHPMNPYSTLCTGRSPAATNTNSRANLLGTYPISMIAQHHFSPSDIFLVHNSMGPAGWTLAAQKQSKISELGYAIGARRFGISIQKQLDEQVQRGEITVAERNYALASTTPVLGQY